MLLIIDNLSQTLIANGLRERVILRVDGGFKSGVDVLMAAAMGADEYGFGSVAMIATGCVMARICHTNNCPVGVASQVRLICYFILLFLVFFSNRDGFEFVSSIFLKFILLQREELRARFPGVPGDLVNFFLYVAEEVVHLPFLFFFRLMGFVSIFMVHDLICSLLI